MVAFCSEDRMKWVAGKTRMPSRIPAPFAGGRSPCGASAARSDADAGANNATAIASFYAHVKSLDIPVILMQTAERCSFDGPHAPKGQSEVGRGGIPP